MIDSIAFACTLLLAPTGVMLVLRHGQMLKLMRLNHDSVWESLGRPKLFFAKTTAETINTFKYLWNRNYADVKDGQFVTLCQRVRTLHTIFIANLALAVALYAIVAFSIGASE